MTHESYYDEFLKELIDVGLKIDNYTDEALRKILADYDYCKKYENDPKRYVDSDGNYHRKLKKEIYGVDGREFIVIQTNPLEFIVKTIKLEQLNYYEKNPFITEKKYKSDGMEYERVSYFEGLDTYDVITREENLVVLKCKRMKKETNEVIDVFETFINPTDSFALNIGGGYDKLLPGGMTQSRTKEEIAVIVDYIQTITGLSPYSKDIKKYHDDLRDELGITR